MPLQQVARTEERDSPRLVRRAGTASIFDATGAWTVEHASALLTIGNGVRGETIDLVSVTQLDTFGGWTLERLTRDASAAGMSITLVNPPERYRDLLAELRSLPSPHARESARGTGPVAALDRIGRATVGRLTDFGAIVAMTGSIAAAFVHAVGRPSLFRPTSIVHHLDRVGWQAIGIILLITFLIGAIIAQQGIYNFRRFGAEDYAVDLVGILVLREIGVLIVAIMLAGRSGSAYTAELGAMKMREEIDALRTMGIDPIEILVLPRAIALVIALPILTFLGTLAALAGGGIVAELYGGMSPAIYIARLHEAVSPHDFYIGMIKAPAAAAAIAIVACAEGLRVAGSTASLGERTTASVVTSIFLVIVLDGLFAIFFASIGW